MAELSQKMKELVQPRTGFLRKCKTQRLLRRRNNKTKLFKLFDVWSRPLPSKTHRQCEIG